MSQRNTNTNTGYSNTNWNQITGRAGRGQEGSGSRGCGNCSNNHENKSIAKYLFEGKTKDGCISKVTITETVINPLNTRRLLILSPSYA